MIKKILLLLAFSVCTYSVNAQIPFPSSGEMPEQKQPEPGSIEAELIEAANMEAELQVLVEELNKYKNYLVLRRTVNRMYLSLQTKTTQMCKKFNIDEEMFRQGKYIWDPTKKELRELTDEEMKLRAQRFQQAGYPVAPKAPTAKRPSSTMTPSASETSQSSENMMKDDQDEKKKKRFWER